MAVPERRRSMLKLREPEVITMAPAFDSHSLGEASLQRKSGQSVGGTSALGRKINDIQKT